MNDRHSRFIRALEAEYEAAVAAGLQTGLSSNEAQARAFEQVKGRGTEVLDQLRAAGLYPLAESEAENAAREGSACA